MKRTAYLALTFAGLCWGVGFPLGKLVLRETDAAHMVLLRLGVAGLAALPFALKDAASRALFRSPTVIIAGMLFGLAFLVQFEGLARTSVTVAALLVGVMPALIAVGARVFGERVSRASWAGVAASTLGAALIAGRPGSAGTPLGVALSLSSLLIFLAWLLTLRRLRSASNAIALSGVTMIVATATVLPLALILHGAPKLDLSPVAWGGILGQGLFCTFLSTAAWQYGQARVGSANAGVFINLEPLMGAVIGVVLFGDHPTLALAAGGALILVGSFVVVMGERGAPANSVLNEVPRRRLSYPSRP